MHNHYVVTKVISNELIYFESVPTRVYSERPPPKVVALSCSRKDNRLITTMDVFVHFDFVSISETRIELKQTIVMVPESPVFKAFLDTAAFLTGTRNEWAKQFRDELVRFKPLIERHT